MYKATVNGNIFDLASNEDGLTINGDRLTWDLAKLSEGHFHILLKNKSYRVEEIKVDHSTKTFSYKINGRLYIIEVKDKFDLLLEKMGMNNSASGKINLIKAPMPGLIIDLKIKSGDFVKTGDALLILEAMKMENILKSPGDGTVKNVKIKKGDSVEKGQVLIEF